MLRWCPEGHADWGSNSGLLCVLSLFITSWLQTQVLLAKLKHLSFSNISIPAKSSFSIHHSRKLPIGAYSPKLQAGWSLYSTRPSAGLLAPCDLADIPPPHNCFPPPATRSKHLVARGVLFSPIYTPLGQSHWILRLCIPAVPPVSPHPLS